MALADRSAAIRDAGRADRVDQRGGAVRSPRRPGWLRSPTSSPESHCRSARPEAHRNESGVREHVGLASTQLLGGILDGLMRNIPDALGVHRHRGRPTVSACRHRAARRETWDITMPGTARTRPIPHIIYPLNDLHLSDLIALGPAPYWTARPASSVTTTPMTTGRLQR